MARTRGVLTRVKKPAPKPKLITGKPKRRTPIPLPPIRQPKPVIPKEPPPYKPPAPGGGGGGGGGTSGGGGPSSTAGLQSAVVAAAGSSDGVPVTSGTVTGGVTGSSDQAVYSTSPSYAIGYSYGSQPGYASQVAQSTTPGTTQAGSLASTGGAG